MTVGEFIRKARGERSLRSVAKELGVSAAFLSDVELGKRALPPGRTASLARVLGLKWRELTHFSEDG